MLGSPASARESKPKDKRVYYTVAQISGIDRSIAYEVIETTKVAAWRAELMKEYREAVKTWNGEAAAFRKDKANRGKKFDKPRPAMPFFVVVKQNIRGKDAADKLVAELEARHSVVKIKGIDGKTTYEAVQSMKLASRKAELDAQYKEAVARRQEESAAFRKENPGKAFTEPKPGRPSMIVVRKDLKDQATAEELAQKLQAGLDKKKTASP